MGIYARGKSLKKREELLGLLKSKEYWITSELAIELDVSLRTLSRYINDLRDQGIPIESERGRGGGIRIDRHYGLGRLNLSYQEIIDLLLALTTLEKLNSPLLLQDLKSIKLKLMQCFPESQKNLLRDLRKRIYVGDKASEYILADYNTPKKGVLENVHYGFLEKRKLEISYMKKDGTFSRRTISPEVLLLNWPVWYIVGFDNLRGEIRNFRTDRIKECRALPEKFKVQKLTLTQGYIKEFFSDI